VIQAAGQNIHIVADLAHGRGFESVLGKAERCGRENVCAPIG
jgi:hypothetical protein